LRTITPDIRIVNLETSVTTSADYIPDKGIHYRMHPANVSCLTAGEIDGVVLANNHAMDWGPSGLVETLDVLHRTGIRTAGAGRDVKESGIPAVFPIEGKGRVLLFAWGSPTSGVPVSWSSGPARPGLNVLSDMSDESVARIREEVRAEKRARDIVVLSIHWGGNWGYELRDSERRFAHRLIDEAGVDIVYGHSSHHPKGIEIYRDKLILYGAGDFLNDYEGITGYEAYRPDLVLMYLPTIDPATGKTVRMRVRPMQIRRFQVVTVDAADARWLTQMLSREGRALGTNAVLKDDGFVELAQR